VVVLVFNGFLTILNKTVGYQNFFIHVMWARGTKRERRGYKGASEGGREGIAEWEGGTKKSIVSFFQKRH